jgi:tRNA threonylcarbamoyladenosine biosynthesis protein TsaB
MKILALELSSARGSVAWRDGDIDLAKEWPNDRQNSGAFFQNLATVWKRYGVPERIIVGLGPGSYAGTRIAISAAIGLARSGAKLFGYPSICALDEGGDEYCVVGDARRNSFFFARISSNNLVEGPDLFGEAELKQKLDKLGEDMPILASEELPQFENVKLRYPSAPLLAKLAADSNRKFSEPPLEPMYLREPYITVPR